MSPDNNPNQEPYEASITPLLARILIGEFRDCIYSLETEIERIIGLLGGVCIEDDLHPHKGNGCFLCGWKPSAKSFKLSLECMVCGKTEVVKLRIPRLGTVPEPAGHAERERFLADHAHPDRGNPMSWAKPMRNMNAHRFAMRLEADLNSGPEEPTTEVNDD